MLKYPAIAYSQTTKCSKQISMFSFKNVLKHVMFLNVHTEEKNNEVSHDLK